jgi:predicted nuclease of restriction endonuclease-like (RecB) superfamily
MLEDGTVTEETKQINSPFSPEITYTRSNDLLADSQIIIETARKVAYKAVDIALVQRNWLLGRRIAEEHLDEDGHAEYGKQVIQTLANQLTKEYGGGFDFSSLYKFLRFFRLFPILDAVRPKLGNILSWSHYRTLLQVDNPDAREWYLNEAAEQTWGYRTLQRNISSQYYQRMLMSQHKEVVKQEMLEITSPLQDRLEFIKNPVIAEFLGMSQNTDFTETELETAILDNIQKFLMELGKGYAFVARQQHIHTEKEDYFIDLVFYNFILKCFVLVDLKTAKITHQDVGQMDMYIRMYDALKRTEGDNPTLGIVLCADTDSDIAKFSVLHGNEQLFASKYILCLPSEEELRAEIETQKQIFLEQHSNEKNM